MLNVEVTLPPREEIEALFLQLAAKALSAVDEAPNVIRDKVILENQDVNGQQMPQKQPRPKRNPKNYPNVACVDTGDMLDNARWNVGPIEGNKRTVTYNGPEFLEYLLTKDADKGGRPWIGLDGTINAGARAEIEQKMVDAVKG